MRSRRVLSAVFSFLLTSAILPVSAWGEQPPSQTTWPFVRADIVVKSVRLVDNGDNDGFADPSETVSLYVTLRNSSGADRHGIVVTVASTDPTVDCIPSPVAAFGSLLAGEVRESAVAVVLRIADVTRSDPFGTLTATLAFQIAGDDFAGPVRPQQVVLDLDLNVGGGSVASAFSEGFEGSGFGAFVSMPLDTNMASNALSNGFRCQYNDPDFAGSNSSGNTFCFLGAATPENNGFDWHVHTTASPDGGRAYLGNNSLHWGMHSGAASADTTRLRQLDAVRSIVPVNLGWNGVTSELSFKHQVGLMDCDYVSCGEAGGIDRGVVQVQLANSSATGVGAWRTVQPYENVYDSQTVDNFSNCLFDPTDDGNTEDDYFDPTDPARRLGPSSTCMPEFAFTRQGAIAFDSTFDASATGHAGDGPGLPGVRGPGTWVKTSFRLDRYRGRRIRLRFLATSLEISNAVTAQQALQWNPIEADDGWYVDDVQVTNTLLAPATVSVDTADRSGLPACGPVCGSVTASLVATPPTLAPGEEVTLDASGSAADSCPGGVLHYRFGLDSNENGVLDANSTIDVGASYYRDVILQEWGPSPVVSFLPEHSIPAGYAVEARCSTRPACAGRASVLVPFVCPDINPVRFAGSIFLRQVVDRTTIFWNVIAGNHEGIDVIRGDLDALRASGGQFNGTVMECVGDDNWGLAVEDFEVPLPGQALYYLARDDRLELCDDFNSWGTGSSKEVPGAGGDRDADIPLDPDTCPTLFP